MRNEIFVAQLSDIHIGGEYDGKFDCIGNLRKVMNKLCELPVLDMVMITGDLCDNHSETEYIDFDIEFNRLKLNFPGIRINAVGGNHDDFFKMSKFMSNVTVSEGIDGNFSYFNITDAKVGLTDFQKLIVKNHRPRNVVMHYPVGDCPHNFMHTEQHDIAKPLEVAKFLAENGVHDVFCGHYHSAFDSMYIDNHCPSVHICPSIQTQLNPNVEYCDPDDKRPGFSLMKFNQVYELLEINHIMVD